MTDKETRKARPENPYVFRDGLRFQRTSLGLVFCPEYNPRERKHSCRDCAACALCSDARCEACRSEGKASEEKG